MYPHEPPFVRHFQGERRMLSPEVVATVPCLGPRYPRLTQPLYKDSLHLVGWISNFLEGVSSGSHTYRYYRQTDNYIYMHTVTYGHILRQAHNYRPRALSKPAVCF